MKPDALANAPRKTLLNRARQRRHYERQEALFREIDALVEELVGAFDRAGCHPIFDHLPEERRERIREVTRRLESKKLVAFRLETDMDQMTLPFSGNTNATRERSRRAAEGIAPKLGARQREVLEWFVGRAALVAPDNQLIAHIAARGGSPNGPRARRIELHRAGLLADSGEERDGCTVWVVTDAGRKAADLL